MTVLSLQLISPEKDYFVGPIKMVVLPGEDGDFSVLLDHAPIITFLRPGKIFIVEEKGKEYSYFVGSGFVKVDNNNCQVLVDYIKEKADLDLVNSKKKLSEVLNQIENESNQATIDILNEKKLIFEGEVNFIENGA